jgi:ABC-2 type transport system permease protein
VILKSAVRMLAFVGKEVIETVRRPGALFSLVAGPFLIMALFGLGYLGRPPLRAELVVPADSGLPQSTSDYADIGEGQVKIVGVTSDAATGRAALANKQADIVIIPPADIARQIQAGKQADLRIEYDTTDPVEASFASSAAEIVSAEVNRMIIEQIAKQGTTQATQAGASPIPPEVISAPTKPDPLDVAPTPPGVVAFFGPAVLALILQHMGVSLSSISLTRERFGGIIEMLRVAPVAVSELLAGKTLALLIFLSMTAAALVALLVGALSVPLLGPPAYVALTVALLAFASIGLGLAVSSLADSERHAVQMSLLILLTSVFFGGFALNLNQFATPIQMLSNVLPVTHGIKLAQDLFLRGQLIDTWRLGALAVMGTVFFLIAWILSRRTMRSAI